MVARAVVVDVAKGDLLAKVMSIMMALGGLAPMVAPVLGGAVRCHSSRSGLRRPFTPASSSLLLTVTSL